MERNSSWIPLYSYTLLSLSYRINADYGQYLLAITLGVSIEYTNQFTIKHKSYYHKRFKTEFMIQAKKKMLAFFVSSFSYEFAIPLLQSLKVFFSHPYEILMNANYTISPFITFIEGTLINI